MWLLSLKLWTPQFGFVVYLKISLWIIAHMVNLRNKNITISNVQTLLSFLGEPQINTPFLFDQNNQLFQNNAHLLFKTLTITQKHFVAKQLTPSKHPPFPS
jgi:hypothetical protein